MVETTPALTPMTTDEQDLRSLSGITLEVRLTVLSDGRRCFSCRESFLFTHFGFSGPAVLDISRHFLRADGTKQVVANFIPDHDENSLQGYFARVQQESPRKTIKNVLIELMPQRLADVILKKAGIESSLAMNQLDKAARKRLISRCVQYPLDVTGVLGYSKAEVTAGGIDWAEINSKTLESKLVPGLYFAGEILDVDGRIGGFNFQWAWASGFTAAQAIIRSFHEQKDR
jgi:predicted Rossmann fold flavoprotein